MTTTLDAFHELATAYAAGLWAYLSDASELVLTRAYELGREAAGRGFGVRELAKFHHDALAELPRTGTDERSRVALAAQFLARSLSPFELMLRAYQTTADDAAASSDRELELFSYSVASNLRPPLRTIDALAQLVAEDSAGRLDDRSRRHLRDLRDSTRRVAELIERLLGLCEVTSSDLHREPVNLSRLARELAAQLRRRTYGPVRQVEITIQDALVTEGDARLLEVVLSELLDNAWKFTNQRAQARIEVGRLPLADPATFFVRDNGAGFNMADAGRLFGMFQRLHPASDFAGDGVGLATVQRIIRRHRGRIWAEGQVGAGAAFYFSLGEPARRAESVAAALSSGGR